MFGVLDALGDETAKQLDTLLESPAPLDLDLPLE